MERAIARDYTVSSQIEIGLTSVGRSDTMPGHKYGPAVRPYYLIHYILSGSGIFSPEICNLSTSAPLWYTMTFICGNLDLFSQNSDKKCLIKSF